jgi:bleomycin hydrolase
MMQQMLDKCATAERALTSQCLAALRGNYVMTANDRAWHNAVAHNPLEELALSRAATAGMDGHFSHRIKSPGIANQGKSGRCWMFAGLNVLRPQVMRRHQMAEFEFSTSYLQFWDKLEKSNLFLESVIELRDTDYLDRDWEMVICRTLLDGGWWNFLAGLIMKYGVVPASAMPETHGSGHTETLNFVLSRLLQSHAVKLLKLHAGGADADALHAAKSAALAEVYRLLVLNLGEPPAEFEWRYRRRRENGKEPADQDSVADADLTPPERHTPRSFFEKYVNLPLADYACLYHDPCNELGRHYQFDRARNIVGDECMRFVNIDMAAIKRIAVASILANEPVWFAVDMRIDQSGKRGLMEHELFDYGALFGLDLTLGKADRIRFYAGASCHAMVLMGVDLDAAGQPRKWLVENSWGEKKGREGCWTLHDRWFDEHVYTIVVHPRHVPAEIMAHFAEEPVVLPAWYPGTMGCP